MSGETPAPHLEVLQALDTHQARRDEGQACASVLVGSRPVAEALILAWARNQERQVATPVDPQIESCVADYAVLLRKLAGHGMNGSRVPPPAKLVAMLEETSVPVPALLIPNLLDERGAQTAFHLASIVPKVPVVASVSVEEVERWQEGANKSDAIAAFLCAGFIVLPESLEFDQIPTPAVTARPRRNGFDSAAERFLADFLEGDPIIRGHFTPQGTVGFQMGNNQPARVDFLSETLGLVIEIDGPRHQDDEQRSRDLRKQAELESAGFQVLRFEASEIVPEFEAIRRRIRTAILAQGKRTFH